VTGYWRREVDFTDPVIPVTRMSPRGISAIRSATSGRFSSAMVFAAEPFADHDLPA
jgi:hypothetical protein